MTVIDQRGWGDRPLNCEVAYEIDRDQGMQIFLETMDAYTVR